MKRGLIRAATPEVKHLQRVAQQDPARAHGACRAKKVEHRNVQPAVESGKCDYETAGVLPHFDDEIRVLARQ